MYFRKYPHPANFAFVPAGAAADRSRIGGVTYTRRVDHFAHGVYRIRVSAPGWTQHSQAALTPPPRADAGPSALSAGAGFSLCLSDAAGHTTLESRPGRTFGVCGQASMFVFRRAADWRFYGLGEKVRGLEHSGTATKFWNTDVLADFFGGEPEHGRPDPYYAAIPYLIIRTATGWIGLLLHNPQATFMDTGAHVEGEDVLLIGCEDGTPELYVLAAPTLRELTQRLQQLVGPTPLPPVWALGYHQCRWGYRSAADLERLDRRFRAEGIPCDGLWLDIDYMDGHRVFTFNRDHFPRPASTFRRLAARGRRVVPILDPGVKRERGNAVYEDGRTHDVFCRNPQGGEFTGLVWPGETVFPDFSLPHARAWWAGHVQRFAERGVAGVWIDMNDPSTGRVDPMGMRFARGRLPHATYHNQYALGMARATRAGLSAARPQERPFLISRSGCTGIGREAALWTGDNFSNYHHLRNAIPTTLNLALSGVPFNGPDVGGFAGHTSPQLIRDWMKACCLFPFCRNHSCTGTRDQEPWAFDRRTRDVLRHYIQLRYKLRPYLYQLFMAQAEDGAAILRPLFHDFDATPAQPLDRVDDQFLVGPWVMQAPLLHEEARRRRVVLPGPARWLALHEGRWQQGGRTVTTRCTEQQTPLYVREGAILPLAAGWPKQAGWTPRRVEVHLFLGPGARGAFHGSYRYDDGLTHAHAGGARSHLEIHAEVRGDRLAITTEYAQRGFGTCRATFVLYRTFRQVTINGRPARLERQAWSPAGRRVPVWSATA